MACLPNHLFNWIVIQSRHWILFTIVSPRFGWGPSIAKWGLITTWGMNEWVKWISFSKIDSNLKRRQRKTLVIMSLGIIFKMLTFYQRWPSSPSWEPFSQSDSKCSGVLSNFCCLRPISSPCFRHSFCRHSCFRLLSHHHRLFSFVYRL